MHEFKSIKRVHLEISTRCNASCPLCPRNIAGFDTDLGYPIYDMTLEDATRIFTESFLLQLDQILINGNFGDFVTARQGPEIVEYFCKTNPKLKVLISTNGSAKPGIWEKLGKIKNLEIGFDLDGLEDTHSLYRRNTNWRLIIDNAKKYINSGGHAIWRMIVFEHNKHQVDECKLLSKSLGFHKFEIINDGRDHSPVYDKTGKYSYRIGNDPFFINSEYPESVIVWKEWSEERQKSNIWPIEPVTNEKICHSKVNREIYITATGEVYPCCWLGFYPKSNFQRCHYGDDELLKAIVANNNANVVGVEQAIKYFNKIESAWKKDLYKEGRLFTCDEYCGKK
jgi:MoaA/NifB/PqqE/SkfB family radical SAM enzyme